MGVGAESKLNAFEHSVGMGLCTEGGGWEPYRAGQCPVQEAGLGLGPCLVKTLSPLDRTTD